MKLYKVLGNEGNSCHGGIANWDLPTKGVDGNWKPSEWMREIEGKLELCVNGYHLVRAKDLLGWLNAAIYEAEHEGEQLTGEDKIVVRKCRLLRKCEGWTEETARLFACWCVRHTPLADGRTTWDLLSDNRSRTAVETAERYAKGEANEGELDAARDAAWAAAGDAAGDAAGAAARAAAWAAAGAAAGDAAGDAAWDAAGAAAWDAAGDAAGAAARDAAWAAARAAAWDAAWDAAGAAAWDAAWAAARAAAWDAARDAAGAAQTEELSRIIEEGGKE